MTLFRKPGLSSLVELALASRVAIAPGGRLAVRASGFATLFVAGSERAAAGAIDIASVAIATDARLGPAELAVEDAAPTPDRHIPPCRERNLDTALDLGDNHRA